MISSMYVPICNRFHISRANNGKMTSFLGGTPLWRPRSRGIPAPSGTKFCHDKLETLGQPTVKISWSYLAPFWYRSQVWQTDRQTDGETPRQWQRRAKHSAFARKKTTTLSTRGIGKVFHHNHCASAWGKMCRKVSEFSFITIMSLNRIFMYNKTVTDVRFYIESSLTND